MTTCLSVTHLILLYRCKALLKVSDDIIDVLSSDRKSDGALMDILIVELFLRKLGMCCCRRMNYKRLNISYVSKEREDLKCIDELVSLGLSSLDIEGEDRTAAVREILLIKLVLRMIRK